MNKGYRAQVIVEQLSKLDEAGMEYIVNFLGGLGGHGYGLRHAHESARVINQLHPTMIYASELTLFPDTPLMQDVKEGKFVEANEIERMEELVEFLNCITVRTVFKAEHVVIPVPIRGHLPEDKSQMLETIGQIRQMAEMGVLAGFCSGVRGL